MMLRGYENNSAPDRTSNLHENFSAQTPLTLTVLRAAAPSGSNKYGRPYRIVTNEDDQHGEEPSGFVGLSLPNANDLAIRHRTPEHSAHPQTVLWFSPPGAHPVAHMLEAIALPMRSLPARSYSAKAAVAGDTASLLLLPA